MPQGLIIDRSSNNGRPVDWAAVKAAGVIGVIIKATQGTNYTNPLYAVEVAEATAAGIPALGYHFAGFTDPAAEAAYFHRVAGPRARILDSEMNTNVAWQDAFLAALNLPAAEEMDYGSASTLPRSGIRALLWPASYGKNYGFGDCWQFTDAQVVPGMPGKVDASMWVGPDADFYALFNITAPVPIPSQPVPPPTQSPRGDLMLHTITVPTDGNGNGFSQTNIPWSTFQAVSVGGSDPAANADASYWPGTVQVQDRGGNVLVTVVGARKLVNVPTFILATA